MLYYLYMKHETWNVVMEEEIEVEEKDEEE